MMTFRKPLLPLLVTGLLLCAGTVAAQDTPPPPTSAPMPMPMPPPPPAPADQPMPAASPDQAMPAAPATAPADATVRSVPVPPPVIGPAPTFEQLSGGGKSISADQAVAYPPLANDFINADTNRNGKVSKAEYARWTKQL